MKINETGFVDYVTSLINETIDAISVAHLEQEQKILDLKNDLLLSDKLLIEKYDLNNTVTFDNQTTEKEKEHLLNIAVENHRELLENYFQKGFVKTFVNGGKLSTKFVFSFSDTKKEPQVKKVEVKENKKKKVFQKEELLAKDITKLKVNLNKMKPVSLSLRNSILKANKIKSTPNFTTKLTVSPISKTNSESDSSTTNITSYLELDFRTVVDN